MTPAALDQIRIAGLRCTSHIGCKEEERALPQALRINATLHLDTREAAEQDNLEKTANYAKLSKAILRACETSRCQLIETLAQNLAQLCLDAHPAIQLVELEIQKPAGLPHGDYAAIAISRRR
ncbi:MAG: dihydroneopterin aldolase [Oligosphaeraceae bacterium]